MVKKGKARAEKAALKYDAYTNMLRAKHLHFATIRNFMAACERQFALDDLVANVSVQGALKWGQVAVFHDKAKELLYNESGSVEDWVTSGLPADLIEKAQDAIVELSWFWYMCAYPRSQMRTEVKVGEPELSAPLDGAHEIIRDLTDMTMNLATLAPHSQGVYSGMFTEVCVHKCRRDLRPTINQATLEVYLLNVTRNNNADLIRVIAVSQPPNVTRNNTVDIDEPTVSNLSPSIHSSIVVTP